MFYVYEHWRNDKNECFYVGKGHSNRAYDLKRRNRHHKAIVAKLHREGFSFDIKIVTDGLTEKEAFDLEVERIAFWRASDVELTNMTNGGEGVSGLKRSEEAKKKMGESKKGNKYFLGKMHSKEVIERFAERSKGNKYFLGKTHSVEARKSISEHMKGKKHALGRKLSKDEIQRLIEITKNRKVSLETKMKMSISHKGKTLSEETKRKIGEAAKKQWTPEKKIKRSEELMGNKITLGRVYSLEEKKKRAERRLKRSRGKVFECTQPLN